jgi:hypothetical protein
MHDAQSPFDLFHRHVQDSSRVFQMSKQRMETLDVFGDLDPLRRIERRLRVWMGAFAEPDVQVASVPSGLLDPVARWYQAVAFGEVHDLSPLGKFVVIRMRDDDLSLLDELRDEIGGRRSALRDDPRGGMRRRTLRFA